MAALFQHEMEQREDLSLQRRLEIDQQIAATDEIEPRKGWIAHQVLRREHHAVAQLLGHLVSVALSFEMLPQAFRGNVGGDVLQIEADAGFRQRFLVEVGGKDLHVAGFLRRGVLLKQQHGEGIRLFTGRASGHPDADPGIVFFGAHQRRDDLLLQGLERGRFAEEPGDADQQVLEQKIRFLRGPAQKLEVIADVGQVIQAHAAFDASLQGAGLVEAEIVLGARLDHCQNRGQVIGDLNDGRTGFDVLEQEVRHLFHRHDVIRDAGDDGAARHAVELRRFRRLHQGHAAVALDGLKPQRAVAAGAR